MVNANILQTLEDIYDIARDSSNEDCYSLNQRESTTFWRFIWRSHALEKGPALKWEFLERAWFEALVSGGTGFA